MTQCPEMPFSNDLKRRLASDSTEDHATCPMRRGLLLAPFLAVLPLELLGETARAGQINPVHQPAS